MSGLHDELFQAIDCALTPSGWQGRAAPDGIEFYKHEPVSGGEFEIALQFRPKLLYFPPQLHLKIIKGNPADFPWHRVGDSLCHFDVSTAEWDPEAQGFLSHVVFIANRAVEEFHRLQKGEALTAADMEFAVQWKGVTGYLDISESAWPGAEQAELERYEFKVPESGLVHSIFRLVSEAKDRYRAYPDGTHHPLIPAVYVELQKHPGPMRELWPPENLGDLNMFLHHHRPKDGKRVWNQLGWALWDEKSDRSNVLLVIQTKAGRFGAIVQAGANPRRFRRHAFPNYIKHRTQLTRSFNILRYSFERLDDDFVLGRNQPGDRLPLAGKKIHLIGLGTIGATLAERLVQAGAGKSGGELHLFDFDRLKTENLGRHLLGVPYLGMSKVQAVTKHLERTRLATGVIPHDGLWHTAALHSGADLVIDATAMPNVGAALSNAARTERTWSLLTAFVEGEGWVAGAFLYRGVAGEACRTCLQPWPGGKGSHIQQIHAPSPKDNGCGSVYTPFRAAASDIAAALASELACEWATGLEGKTYRTIRLPSAPRHVHGPRNETPRSHSSCVCAREKDSSREYSGGMLPKPDGCV